MPSLGELSMGSWGPAPTPAGMPGEGVYPVEFSNRRTNVVRLLPNGAQERKPRKLADVIHSDLNGALNIMKKATGKIPLIIKKPLSFIVDHNKVAPPKGR